MAVPNWVTKNVVLIGYPDKTNGDVFVIAGTGFVVGYPNREDWDRDKHVPQKVSEVARDGHTYYLVTAKHVIENLLSKGVLDVTIRANDLHGKLTDPHFTIGMADWTLAPDHDGHYIDVAAAKFGVPDGWDITPVSLAWSAHPRRIEHASIGLGDDLFHSGAFNKREGRTKIIPVVRRGTFAAWADEDEPITTVLYKGGPTVGVVAHLIETRSTGGVSGAPVFVHMAGIRTNPGYEAHPDLTRSHGSNENYLLGLVSGHWDENFEESGLDQRINLGMGYVTPVDAILEVLEMDNFESERRAVRDKKRADNAAVADSAIRTEPEGRP